MKCPECGYEDSKVIDSRPAENKIRRRRECLSCKCRFTTYEMVETIPLMVVKKDNTIEPFDRDKLINRLARATVKRPVQIEDLEKMVEDIENVDLLRLSSPTNFWITSPLPFVSNSAFLGAVIIL